jgi:gas vesicle protein
MKPTDITDWFFELVPFRRRRSVDWVLASTVGLGVGIAAGVGIGVLLAPRPGAEMRERLRAGAENLIDKARDLGGRAKDQIENATQQLGQGLSGEMHESR